MMCVLLQVREVHAVPKYTFVLGENKTPCTKQCKLDSTKSYCVSCLRSIREIIEKGKQIERRV